MADFTLSNDPVGAMDLLRKRMECNPTGDGEPYYLYLNDAEYAYFKAHEWIDFGIGTKTRNRRFTNAQCHADTGIPAHTEILMASEALMMSYHSPSLIVCSIC